VFSGVPMPSGYKVRLADGSEIGPLDLAAVKDWRLKGLIEGSSPVLPPGAKRWSTVSQVLGGSSSSARTSSVRSVPTPRRAAAMSTTAAPAPRSAGRGRTATARSGNRWLILAAIGIVVALGGAAAAYRLLLFETPTQRRVREASTGERHFVDQSLGLRLDVPSGWWLLRKDQSLFQAPPDARLVAAQPRAGVFAFLTADSGPSGVASLDQYMDRVLAQRRKVVGAFSEYGRIDTRVSTLPARQASSTWTAEGVRYAERTVVWKDGWVYFALSAWAPESAGTAGARPVDTLVAAFHSEGDLDGRLRQAVKAVTSEVPVLNESAASVLMSRSSASVLEPDQAFRRSLEALSRSIRSWKGADLRDIGSLTSATYAGLPARDRARLASYIDRVRNGKPTTPQEDKEMCEVMKGAVLRLQPARRVRLQALYEQAVLASAGG
jgi:hypothetical protein